MRGPLWITGHAGLVGSALMRVATGRDIITATHAELDLRDAAAVARFIAQHRPSAIIHAAARNAGIAMHEAEPAAMLSDNLAIAINPIVEAHKAGVSRLLYISSACVYAGGGNDPVAEPGAATTLPGGPTAGYALAKIAAMKLCETIRDDHDRSYHSIIPCNLYGPGDNFDSSNSTVVAGMMRRMHEAARAHEPAFSIWGSGNQRREFLHADDLAAACLLLLSLPDSPPRANCGPGISAPLIELARQLKAVTGYAGTIVADPSKPEGSPRPLLDSSLLRSLGWSPRIALEDGLRSTYAAFKEALLARTLRGV